MKNLISYSLFESLKFTKQPKKKGSKTDTFNVSKSGNIIGQVKWYHLRRGYAFLPSVDCDEEIKNFIRLEMTKYRRNKKKKN